VRRARYVVALDADLGSFTHNTLARMVDRVRWAQKPFHLWINETSAADRRTIELYESKNHLMAELLQAIADGKRCFVTANSKKLIMKIEAIIREQFGDTRRLVTITADTGAQAEVQDFVANAAARAATYDVILCSPSLGTGVDITFPDNARLVDVVFGFCEPKINTHLDFDQQLARVRHPGAVKVWITPRRFNFETHLDVVPHDILRAGLYKDMLDDYGDDGKPRFLENDPLIEMAALHTSAVRTSMNNLSGNYVRYKEAQGCTIVHVGNNLERSVNGYAALRRGADLADEAIVARILEASVLTRPEYERVQKALEDGAVLDEALSWSYQRTHLELFYRTEASPELVQLDRNGGRRREIRLFQDVTRMPPEAVPDDRLEPLHKDLSFVGEARRDLAPTIVRLLRLTPLWRAHHYEPLPMGVMKVGRGRLVPLPDARRLVPEGRVAGSFDPEAVFDTRDLQAFADFMLVNKGPVETLLRHEVRSDIRKKPAQQLGLVLGKMGLGLSKASTFKVAGRKIRRYGLDVTTLSAMEAIVARRERQTGWAFLVDHYGSHMDPDGEDWAATEAEIERVAALLRGQRGISRRDEFSLVL
jgi:hypothetical protein